MYKKSIFLVVTGLALTVLSCKNTTESNSETTEATTTIETDSLLPLEKLMLPEGFKISLFAKGIDGARSMAMGDNGTLYVGTRTENTLYAVEDSDGDFKADRVVVLDTSLNVPNGVAFKNGSLYVAEVNRLLRYDNVENDVEHLPEPEVIYDDYPDEFHHGWKYIAFGPDEKLYVPVGAPCNICDSAVVDQRYASITRMNADGSDREIYAHGVRNTVGFDWHPDSKELWFTDNGRDLLGDNIPPCELNRVEEMGQHFGYPFCHAGLIADPEYGDQRSCDEFVAPVQQLAPHSAPLAVKFYTGDMFPKEYKNYAFIAEHGSWNRTQKIGYRIMLVELKDNKAVAYKTFLDGWLDDRTQERWGRPVDILFLKDGSMLISDDFGDAIYRVTYENPA